MAKTYQVYRHYDEAGTLLYVGMCSDVITRTIGHRTRAKWFSEIATIRVQHFGADYRAAVDAELDAIRTEKPKYNVRRNRKESNESREAVHE